MNTDLKSPDLDWNFAYVGIWTEAESNMAIFAGVSAILSISISRLTRAACLPSLRPILLLILTGKPNSSHNYASGSSQKKDNRASYGPRLFGNISSHTENKSLFVQLSEPVHGGHEEFEMSQCTVASGGKAEAVSKVRQVGAEDVTNGGINVINEVEVGWSRV